MKVRRFLRAAWWAYRFRVGMAYLAAALILGLMWLGAGLVDTEANQLRSGAGLPTATPQVEQLQREQAAALCYAYNLAMQDFDLTLNTALVYPFVHPEGPLWKEIKTLAEERALTGEIHYATLRRFGVGEVRTGADAQGPFVVVHAAEQWDDMAVNRRTGETVYDARGISQEVAYTLRPGGGRWLLWSEEILHTVGSP